jgi:predicted metalloprotease
MFGGGMAPMGIGGTIVLLVLGLLFGKDFTGGTNSGPQTQVSSGDVGPIQQSPEEARTAQFVNFLVDDIQDTVWSRLLPGYQDAKLVLYRDATPTACGLGQSAAGPFYCPNDEQVYIDLGFYDELRNRFGAGGEFAEAYVLAHEFGHHVQHQLGTDVQLQRADGNANAKSVQLELQADCYAGVWGHYASQHGQLAPGEMEQGLKAASALGDDKIQEQTTGVVRPESFTHGSSTQRVAALDRGLDSGDPKQCQIGSF